MRYRDRQDTVLALHRLDAVNQAAHRLDGGRIALELAAVVDRRHGPYLAAQSRQHEVQYVLGSLDEVDVWELLIEHEDVGRRHALRREMAMRVVRDADHAFGAGNRPRPLDDVAFDVVEAVRNHGAVQPEQQAVDRHRRLELVEDLVAHGLVVGAIGRAGVGRMGNTSISPVLGFRSSRRSARTAARWMRVIRPPGRVM